MKITRRPPEKPELLGLKLYDKMLVAIAECQRIDEVKEIHDRVAGLEKYAAQAQNYDAELRAMDVRVRASEQAGKLIAKMNKQHGARGKPGPGRGKKNGLVTDDAVLSPEKTLKELGITPDQSSQWQQLAGIPKAEFEKRLPSATGERTSIKRIIRETRPAPPDPAAVRLQRVRTLALRVWGDMRDLPQVIEDVPMQEVVAQLNEMMVDDVAAAIPKVREFVKKLESEIANHETRKAKTA